MAIEKLNENGSETQEWWRFQNWCCSCGSGDQWETPESKKKSVLITIPNDVFPQKKSLVFCDISMENHDNLTL